MSIRTLVGFLGIAVGLSPLLAQVPELGQQQSLPRPAPTWLKMMDQGKNDPRLKGYVTPEGLKVEIVADYPTVMNPVGMTFADDGTPYVLEWRPDPGGNTWPEFAEKITYKDGTSRPVATMKKHVKDVVKVLRDTNGTGVYDEAKVILEEELPSSLMLHDGWLYISSRGSVRRYRQSKAGGPYDVREVIAQGFCGFHHHQVSGLTIGNDGWLYITAGDDDNLVEGSDGSRVAVLRSGAIFRCRPDGSKMQVFSMGYRNPYRDVSFDAAFNMFHADNDNEDGSKFTGCRLMHVPEGSDFGWRLRVGARCCSPDAVRGAIFGELPGKMPALLKTGRGSPAGLLIYNDTYFPKDYRGLLYYPDVFRKLIRAYRVEPRGASFEVVEEFEFMKSDDPLFRPCQMVVGPDGAMYICDWRTDSGGAGQLWGNGHQGRIYRVTWAGTPGHPPIAPRSKDSWQRILTSPGDELLKQLASENISDRLRAQRELAKRGERNRPALLKILGEDRQPLRARIAALGSLESLWNREVQIAVLAKLNDPDSDLRRLAADALALNVPPGDPEVVATLVGKLKDPSPGVRRAAALALGKVGGPNALQPLIVALVADNGNDLYLHDGLIRAIELTGKGGIAKLISLADSGSEAERNLVAQVFLTLRTREAVNALPSLLYNPHITTQQRTHLLGSYANYLLVNPLWERPDYLAWIGFSSRLPFAGNLAWVAVESQYQKNLAQPMVSVEPVVDFLIANRQENVLVKLAGLEILALPGTYRSDRAITLLWSLLEDPDPSVRLASIKALTANPQPRLASPLVRLVGNPSRTVTERVEAIHALRALGDKSAIPILKELLLGKKVVETETIRLEALRSLAQIDSAVAQETARWVLEHEDPFLANDAVQILGSQVAGAKLVGKLFLAHKLPSSLLQPVTDALQKHVLKDPEAARLLVEVLKGGLLLNLNSAEVERVRLLVRTKGDPNRGKALFLNSQKLACINCHRLEGVGGNVGPDLTRLWDTQSVEKIMESVIEPSKEIKEGYQTYVATTIRGQVFTGLKVAQTPVEVILRDANAKEIHILAKDLDQLEVSRKSLMPENAFGQLTFDQFIDLVAFLKDRRAQESLQGTVRDFWVVGPFGEDLRTFCPPETKPDPAAIYSSQHGPSLVWQPRQTEANGYLNLHVVVNKDRASEYALTYVYSPKPQKVQMLVGSGGPLRVWLNGGLIHERTTSRTAKPDEDRVDISLKEGWNPVLAKVVNLSSDSGLFLRFAGGQGLREALKPEAPVGP